MYFVDHIDFFLEMCRGIECFIDDLLTDIVYSRMGRSIDLYEIKGLVLIDQLRYRIIEEIRISLSIRRRTVGYFGKQPGGRGFSCTSRSE